YPKLPAPYRTKAATERFDFPPRTTPSPAWRTRGHEGSADLVPGLRGPSATNPASAYILKFGLDQRAYISLTYGADILFWMESGQPPLLPGGVLWTDAISFGSAPVPAPCSRPDRMSSQPMPPPGTMPACAWWRRTALHYAPT